MGQWLIFGWFWGWGTSDMQFAPVRSLALKIFIAVVWHGKTPPTRRAQLILECVPSLSHVLGRWG